MKQNHNKKLFFIKIFLFSLLILFTKISVAFAAEPKNIPDVIKNIFQWGIGISSLLAGISFAVGAVQFIASGTNPTIKNEGKDRMIGATLGLALLFASYLILNSINPKISEANPKQMPADFGIFYSNGNPKENKTAPLQEADISIIKKLGYKEIIYKCPGIEDGYNSGIGAPLRIWYFPRINFEDPTPNFSKTIVEDIVCGESKPIDIGKSFKLSFIYPAVYLYTEEGCKGFVSDPITGDARIPEPFAGKAKSAKIIETTSGPGAKDGSSTLIIFHENEDPYGAGECSAPLSIDYSANRLNQVEQCFEINIPAGSITVANQEISGNRNSQGLRLYSKPWGWKDGAFAGVNDQTIKHNFTEVFNISPNEINFSYKSCSSPAKHDCETKDYQKICKTFADCPGSIQVVGKYLVAFYNSKPKNLWSDQDFRGGCQTFRENINSLKEKEFSATGYTLRNIFAFPIK